MSNQLPPETSAGNWAAEEGLPFPLGVSWIEEEDAFNFAVHSRHAEKVGILFFKSSDLQKPFLTYPLNYLKNKTNHVWHCRIPRSVLQDVEYYAFAVDGPKVKGESGWQAFQPDKLLFDPYARSVFFPPHFSRRTARHAGPNLGKAPLGVLSDGPGKFDWGDQPPVRHDSDLVIYELHVKGFTRHPSSGVTASKRGTYLGLLEKVPYLQELGITAVELMPVFQFDPQEENYWGYMPISFFAPHSKYAVSKVPQRQIEEFRQLVKGLHDAGIEVIIDVVYNHTGEGNSQGPVYSLKGLDNATYYLMAKAGGEPYEDYSGTGNSLNCGSEATRKLVLDSMRYWVEEMRVDGFRFDLASELARNADGSLNHGEAPLFGQIAADPLLRQVRLIAEPWDAGGAYQLGCAFPGRHWLQWNDRYRDQMRRFVRGDPDMVAKVMARLYGSSDIFPETRIESYHPYQSVNYIASHDGFTLYDLVAYNQKHNAANGHDGTDGPHENFSWNCGVEGDKELTPEILKLRKQQVKNFFCLLMLSNGTPMFRAGDEFLQTQGGNNNPYNQDNEISWLDWSRLKDNGDIFRFFRLMIAFRKKHPSICRSRFWRGDVRWYGVNREVDLTYYSRSLAFCLHGASVGDSDIYVMINCYSEDLIFGIQEGGVGHWKKVVDTSKESPDDILEEGKEVLLQTKRVRVKPRSVVVLVK